MCVQISLARYFQGVQSHIYVFILENFISEQSVTKHVRENGFYTHLFVCTDTRRTTEVKLGSFDCEFLTGPRVAITIKATAFAAVHCQLPNLAPRYKTSITTEFVQTTLMVDLMLNLQTQRHTTIRRNPTLNLNVVNYIFTKQTALVSLTRLEILQTLQIDLSDCLSTGFSGNFSGTFSCFLSVHLSGVLSGCFLLCLKTDRQNRPQKCR